MGSIKELRLQHQAVVEKVRALGTSCHRMGDMEEALNSLRETLQKYPDPEELRGCVTWDEMQSALFSTETQQEVRSEGSQLSSALLWV
ncbi:Hypothetical protein SMAX5B_020045 [Scophthalmus maximus]|uniref:Uncharacterized protein n=1 Tax=Scophthalmus maximus TaxID=52904 RepID=A0A2U9CSF1_SCOMX|nr:Hypothetical protein SMAX5B_020045 [Scophthalmus maximus]